MGSPAAGWYVDPADGARYRYWNGSAWTNETRTAPPPTGPPMAGAATDPAGRPPSSAPGTGNDLPPEPAREVGARRRTGLIGGAIGLVAVIAVGFAVWVLPGGAGISDTIGYEWERLSEAAITGHDGGPLELWDVAYDGQRWVAVGNARTDDGRVGVVLVSEDGRSWERLPHDASVFAGDEWVSMDSVFVGGPGFVATGHDGDWSDNVDAAVWLSEDGLSWERVRDDALLGGGELSGMWSVATHAGRLVGVGTASDHVNVRPLVWTSDDGSRWQRIDGSPAFGASDDEATWTVTAGGPGLIAVGYGTDQEGDRHPIVWTSSDSDVWRRTELPGRHTELLRVAVTSDGLVAVGRNREDPWGTTVWTSEDGEDWRARPTHGHTGEGELPVEVNQAIEIGSRKVAIGTVGPQGVDDEIRQGTVWISGEDGVWDASETRVSGATEARMWALAGDERQLVAVGTDEGEDRPAIWVSE